MKLMWLLMSMLAAAAPQEAEKIRVSLNRSFAIDLTEDVSKVATSNPGVADYVLVSAREILVHAKGLGSSSIVVWTKPGTRRFFDVSVEPDIEALQQLVRQTFPEEPISVLAARESISLNGEVSSKEVADRAAALLAPAAKSVVNNLRVRDLPADRQILLRVKFAEVNRSVLKALGVNLFSTGALNTIGAITTGQFPGARANEFKGTIGAPLTGAESTFNLSDVLNILAFRPDLNLGVAIKALQQNGILQILAEPNLVTSNGKEASFLVGGEFPVPVLQGGANAGSITVQFREFGIRLSFLPQLTGHDNIRIHVKPEVSTIDLANAVSLSGYQIPALSTRRIESTVELGPGQSFVIGGLIDDRTTENLARIPGLGNIPILGYLFRSRQENRTKTELVVLVTPEVVEPLPAGRADETIQVPKPPMEPLLKVLPDKGTPPASPSKD